MYIFQIRFRRDYVFCYSCGYQLPKNARFCISCGQKLFEADAEPKKKCKSPADIKQKMNSAEFERIVNTHAFGAAAAAISAVVPGIGTTIAVTISLGFIVSMYVRLSEYLGMSLEKNALKALASAVLSHIAAFTVVSVAVGAVLSFIPVVGSIGAVTMMAATQYATVKVSVLIFKVLISSLLNTGKDLSAYSEEDLKELIKNTISEDELKAAMENAKAEFIAKKESGEFDSAEKAEVISDL